MKTREIARQGPGACWGEAPSLGTLRQGKSHVCCNISKPWDENLGFFKVSGVWGIKKQPLFFGGGLGGNEKANLCFPMGF